MNVLNRVGKLEHETGINEPCEVCNTLDETASQLIALAERLGVESYTEGKVITP
jgi:hypothetical protein